MNFNKKIGMFKNNDKYNRSNINNFFKIKRYLTIQNFYFNCLIMYYFANAYKF